MGWNTQPPTNPPERSSIECDTCGGEGEYIEYEQGEVIYEGECGACDGTGEIQTIEPDTWKEASGWA